MQRSGTLLLTTVLTTALAGFACRSDPPNNSSTPRKDAGVANDSGTHDHDSGTVTHEDGGTTEADSGSTGNTITVQEAVADPSSHQTAQIDNAVVIAESHYTNTAGGTVGTFYIQDNGASGPGLAVYHSGRDTTLFPAVGDIVSVSGRLGRFNGSLQISSSTRNSITLSVTKTGSDGTVTGGAMPPAGQPLTGQAADYAHDSADDHADQVGNVIQFGGAMTITNPRALVSTDTDGGVKPTGFEVTGGLWVNDTNVYYNCIKPLDGGVLDLSRGIRGVWDRYQDYNAGSGQNPAPVVPVLVPMSCADLAP